MNGKSRRPQAEASRPASKQLGLWGNSTMQIVIKTGAICSECKEERAKKVVEFLDDKGYNVIYGGVGYGSVLPDDEQFTSNFYEAVQRSQYA